MVTSNARRSAPDEDGRGLTVVMRGNIFRLLDRVMGGLESI
jgi:hypothetical protein